MPSSGQRHSTYREALPYRRDIDGLRALAVLAVIAFHGFPDVLGGGFVGVDVFFVISGFLITGIIVDALRSDTFSFGGFYAARTRRIFPALMLVLATGMALGWGVLLDSEFRALGKHVLAAAGFVSNFVLWSESGYFDTDAAAKPLLHLWSLGIEEQFYLLWPLILWTVRKRVNGAKTIAATLAAVSFACNLWMMRHDSSGAYYLPATRAWELLVGAMLACLSRDRPQEESVAGAEVAAPRGDLRNLVSWCGLLLVAVAAFWYGRSLEYPGWLALVPTLGAAALIAAGPEAVPNRILLGNRCMVAIGLVSYPLYLWHWLLLSLLHIVEPKAGYGSIATAVAASFVLAWLTWRFVERPIRRKRPKPWSLLLVMALVGVAGCACMTGSIEPRSASFGLEPILKASLQHVDLPRSAMKPFGSHGQVFYRQGGTEKVTLFIGDSNVEQYYPRIDKLLSGRAGTGRGVVFASSSGCPPIPGIREMRHYRWCEPLIAEAFAYARNANVDTVVIAANWYWYFNNANPDFEYMYGQGGQRRRLGIGTASAVDARDALGHAIADLEHQGKKVYLVLNIPTGDMLSPMRLVKRSLLGGFRIDFVPLRTSQYTAMIKPVIDPLRTIGANAGATIIDPLDYLCGPSVCPALAPDGSPMYLDGSHLRVEYVRKYVTYLDRTVPM
jgi:peptidoglycan/LPS O-acetylase OafA/YrhL